MRSSLGLMTALLVAIFTLSVLMVAKATAHEEEGPESIVVYPVERWDESFPRVRCLIGIIVVIDGEEYHIKGNKKYCILEQA